MKNVLKTSVLVLSVFMLSNFAVAKEKVNKEKTAEKVVVVQTNCMDVKRTMIEAVYEATGSSEKATDAGVKAYGACLDAGGDPGVKVPTFPKKR